MNEISEIFTSEKFRKIATPVLTTLLEKGLKIIESLKSDFKIEGQEVTFLCPENTQKWSIAFICKRNILQSGSKDFRLPGIKQVNLKSIVPLKDITSEAINMLPEGGFKLSYSNLQEGTPYIIDVVFDIENPKFIDAIVDRTVQPEAFEDKKEYWMHAQLKFIDVLQKYYSQVKLNDLDFNVDVAVHEDIKTSIPYEFEKELEVVVEWMKETDRERKYRLSWQHLHMIRTRKVKKEDLFILLRNLQDIFLPRTFRRFVVIKKDFYYHDCVRGADYYSAPFPTWPKFMTVVSRTNLNVNKPAATGILEFNCKEFRKEIDQILGKK